MMRAAGEDPDGIRLRGLIVVLWRASLRISEALALSETDLDAARGAILVRQGKGGKRREVGMDRWAWDQLQPWLALRRTLPVGALFCILRGPTRGRRCAPAGIRAQLRRTAERTAAKAITQSAGPAPSPRRHCDSQGRAAARRKALVPSRDHSRSDLGETEARADNGGRLLIAQTDHAARAVRAA